MIQDKEMEAIKSVGALEYLILTYVTDEETKYRMLSNIYNIAIFLKVNVDKEDKNRGVNNAN